MPIIKRRSLTKQPDPMEEPTLSEEEAPPEPPKATPVRKPTNVKKRKPLKQNAVYLDGDILVVKTPHECTSWPTDFRLRIVRDFRPDKTIMSASSFYQSFTSKGQQDEVHRIMGCRVRVRNAIEPVSSTHVVLLRTEVIDLDRGKALFLHHPDAAMRVLMVYSFLKQMPIAGVPPMSIYDYPPDTEPTANDGDLHAG